MMSFVNPRKILFSFFLSSSIVAACGATPTKFPTQIIPSSTQPTQSFITPSVTIDPQMATRIAAHTAKQTATAQKRMNDCNGFYDEAWGLRTAISEQSPSGKWRIAYCQYPDTGSNYTKVIDEEASIEWEVPYYDKNGQKRPEGSTGGQMILTAWSVDEKFAFFERYFCCVDGPGMFFSNGFFDLYRLNLSDGELKKLDGGVLSPDGYQLISEDSENKRVIVENLKTEQRVSFYFDKQFSLAGMFLWSHDGRNVVFTATDEGKPEAKPNFALYLVDTVKNSLRLLLLQKDRYFFADKWLSENEILLYDFLSPDIFTLNIDTLEVAPIDSTQLTTTPTP